jgi:hypothetical protein
MERGGGTAHPLGPERRGLAPPTSTHLAGGFLSETDAHAGIDARVADYRERFTAAT